VQTRLDSEIFFENIGVQGSSLTLVDLEESGFVKFKKATRSDVLSIWYRYSFKGFGALNIKLRGYVTNEFVKTTGLPIPFVEGNWEVT
jgi:hypothetical protein